MGEDGWVSIKLDLETKNFDAEIKKSENELEKLRAKEAELIKLNERFSKDTKNGGRFVVSAEEYNRMQKLGITMEEIGNKDTFLKLQSQIENTSNKIIKLREQQRKLGDSNNLEGIKNNIETIDNGINKVTKKVLKWGLAVFGIRSAYLGIRQAISILSQYDDKLSANINYIKYALATALKPIIEWIVNAVYKLLQYINYIANAWFGINLFANASVKAFNKANSSAKKLKNTLASFDEMNVLTDNTQETTGTPSFDLTKLGNVEIPEWVKWIADNKDTIMTVAEIAAGIFGASVIAGWISNLGNFINGPKGLSLLSTKLGAIVGLVGGIAITTLVATKVWQEAEELKKEIQSIREVGIKGQEEWIKNEKDLNTLINTGNVNRTAGYKLLEKSGGIWNWINGLGKENLETAKQTAINISKQIDKELELYKTSDLTNEEQKKIRDNIIEQYKYNLQVISKLKENKQETSQIEALNQKLIQNYKDMGGNVTGIKEDMNLLGIKIGEINGIKFDDKELNVDVKAKTNEAENTIISMVDRIKTKFNDVFKNVNLKPLADRMEAALQLNDKIAGTNFVEQFRVARKRLGLAKGGIISMPGKGVPLTSGVVGGERQYEGVFPLTDSQQMELLGSTIGRYVTIPITNIIELDGRQIARKVDKVQQNNNFVLNR